MKVVSQQKPTVVHGHLHEGGLIGWCVKVLFFWRRIKLVMDLQGSLSGELRAYGTFRKLPFMLSFFLLSRKTDLPDAKQDYLLIPVELGFSD